MRVGDFCKVNSAQWPVLLYLLFLLRRVTYIFMYYEFYNLQRLIIFRNVSVHTAVFSIFVINTWDHVSCNIFATSRMIRQAGTLVWVNL